MRGYVQVDGMVFCPKRAFAGMARDACVGEQERCGDGCGIGCPQGARATEDREKFLAYEQGWEKVREAVKERHRLYYRKWGQLPSQRARKPKRARLSSWER